MSANKPVISVHELKLLVSELIRSQPDIGIRHRLIGENWYPRFVKIAHLHPKGVTLNDESSSTLLHVSDLSSVMQFQLDQGFLTFQAYFTYDVVVRTELHLF